MTKKGVNLNEFFKEHPDLAAGAPAKAKIRAIRPPVSVDEEMVAPVVSPPSKKPKSVKNVILGVQPDVTNSTILKNKMFSFIDPSAVSQKDVLLDFVIWSGHPRRAREPKTAQEFAEKCGVGRETLSRWKNLVGFWKEVALHRTVVFRNRTTDVLYALTKAAIGGNVSAQKLFLQYVEGWSEKVSTQVETPLPRKIMPDVKDPIL